MRVSVIIPVKAINAYIHESIPRLLAQTHEDFEVIVLPDHASTEQFPKTRIIETWPDTGPAAKRDIGAAAATGEVLAFLDDDAYPEPNWLERAVAHFEESNIAALGGPNVTPPEDDARRQASGWVSASMLGSGGYRYRFTPQPGRDIDDFPSVNLFVRKAVFEAVGGFDSDYWPGEDTKLCLDIRHGLGRRIRYEPDVLVYHHRRPLFREHLAQHIRYAIHRGYFARVLPATSRRLSYFVPSAFALGLIAGPFVGLFHPALMAVYLGVVGVYAAALAATAIHVAWKSRSIRIAVLAAMGIVATHVVYGVMLLRGVLGRPPARYHARPLPASEHVAEAEAVGGLAGTPER